MVSSETWNKVLQSLPVEVKSGEEFRDWLYRGGDADSKRSVVSYVEERIKSFTDNNGFLLHLDEKTWEELRALVKIRQLVLNALMVPTKEEVKLMSKLNDHLLYLSYKMYDKAVEMRKMLDNAGKKGDDYSIDATVDFEGYNDDAVKKLDNDDYYGSDFTTLLAILTGFCQKDQYTMKHILDISQELDRSDEEIESGLTDHDDTLDWHELSMYRLAFKDIHVCYALHALCFFLYYSVPYVLRMDDFSVRVSAVYAPI